MKELFIKTLLFLFMQLCVVESIAACEKNRFFKIDIPPGWQETCVHGEHIALKVEGFLNSYASKDKTKRYQIVSAHVLRGDVDGKEWIYDYVMEDLDISITENLCYFSKEDFHGYGSVSYSFGGKAGTVYVIGKANVVKARGFTMIFLNIFFPNKFQQRKEVDVWKGLKWLPEDKWQIL